MSPQNFDTLDLFKLNTPFGSEKMLNKMMYRTKNIYKGYWLSRIRVGGTALLEWMLQKSLLAGGQEGYF